MAVKEIQHGNVTIVLHRPELTEEERKKSETNILRAMQQIGKEIVQNREKRA